MKSRIFGAGMLVALLSPAALQAAPVTIALNPGNMLAQTHSRAMFITVTGTFSQLSGTLTYDPAANSCAVDVTFVVESMKLPNALIRSQTMSKGFLDPQDYPTQHYTGTCHGGTLTGELTMRGQTHAFDMTVTNEMTGGQLTGFHLEGTLNRHDWGLNGLTLTVGKMINVTNDIELGK